jgi:hypothetical protein
MEVLERHHEAFLATAVWQSLRELGYIFYHITPAVPWRASRRNELYPRCIFSAARSALSAALNNSGEQDVELVSSAHDAITLLRQHVSLAASLHVEL